MKGPITIIAVCFAGLGSAQVNAPVNGPHDKARQVEAFVRATIHTTPGQVIRNATMLIQGDKILAVGDGVQVPEGSVVHDLAGRHLWPALIDPYSDLGMVSAEKEEPQERGAHYWNPAIRASRSAAQRYKPEDERIAKLREQGFGLVLTHRMDGIARGTGALVLLAGRNEEQDMLVPAASAHFSFRKGSSNDPYPSSLMGSIALLRQALYDARWYSTGSAAQTDVDLQALNEQAALPWVFETSARHDPARIAALGREFGRSFIVKGRGDEYQHLEETVAAGTSLILPLTLPDASDVEDPFEALEVSLEQLKHWELAPHDPRMLAAAGVQFAFTTNGLKEPSELWSALHRMVRCGLDSSIAIAAFTTIPSELFGVSQRCGTIEAGKLASFIVSSGHLLDEKNVIQETWVAGQRFTIKPPDGSDLRGEYDLNLRDRILRLQVKGGSAKPEFHLYDPKVDSIKVKADVTRQAELISIAFDGSRLNIQGHVRLNGIIHAKGGIWDGQGQLPGGAWIGWTAVKQQEAKGEQEKKKEEKNKLDSLWAAPPGMRWLPPVGYGSPELPDSATVIFRHATIWTNGPEGILRDTDLCMHEGKVRAVGKSLDAATLFPEKKKPQITEIDARGRHLTSGIIDEHSHIAIARGVNEGGQAISAEVRIGDVIDPDDVNIYRNLSGGVTAVQQLHGSANPIGGQSALIKLRWGLSAEQMKIDGAPGFIKFALGENVKQSTSESSTRFPRTRMGVEQIMFDAFHRAREYARTRDQWSVDNQKSFAKASLAKGADRERKLRELRASGPRVDLELDALAEILAGKRFITCHSYVQAEILMLIRLADSLGFKVNTFTHILEGYKVARKMQEHGVSASSFSDWWAYKFEVYDAIPYNAALLHAAGVNVCINSDDAEMSRRLNQEAAKAVKYGGVSEEEAWKMLTLNPAKALRLDHRMGSLEVGKDADVVLWNANPLGISAQSEMTFVDGLRYFDRARDHELRKMMLAERERLVGKMMLAKKSGTPTRKGGGKERGLWECETIGEEP